MTTTGQFHSHVWADDPRPGNRPPPCPSCRALARWQGHYWETAHELECEWMSDTCAEGYA